MSARTDRAKRQREALKARTTADIIAMKCKRVADRCDRIVIADLLARNGENR